MSTLLEKTSLFSNFKQRNIISTAVLEITGSSAWIVMVPEGRPECPIFCCRFSVRLLFGLVTICWMHMRIQILSKRTISVRVNVRNIDRPLQVNGRENDCRDLVCTQKLSIFQPDEKSAPNFLEPKENPGIGNYWWYISFVRHKFIHTTQYRSGMIRMARI